MSREPRPRCGKWMPNAQEYCALPEGHHPKCRTASSVKVFNSATTRRNQVKCSERQALLNEYKLRVGCEVCGYDENPFALDFDHLDPAAKVANISRLLRYAPWKTVVAEMGKCRVLCANHHRIWTLDPEAFPMERRRPGADLPIESGPNDEITDHPQGQQR